jgi:hypothetical protein
VGDGAGAGLELHVRDVRVDLLRVPLDCGVLLARREALLVVARARAQLRVGSHLTCVT